MHASCTVPVVCMLGASVNPWQETHPALLLAASSCDCPLCFRDVSGDCPGSRTSSTNKVTPPARAANGMYLETEPDIGSDGKQGLVSKDIAEPLRRGKRIERARNHHVLGQRRAIRHAQA